VSDTAERKEHLVMEHLVSLTYEEQLTPNLQRFADALMEGRLTGHKCPSCGRVYVPGRGYCPMCVVETTQADEVEVSDHGTLTGFTIITPVQYYGQQETEPFVHASVLLDGADSTLGGQEIVGVPREDIRMGMRVKAKWRAPADRTTSDVSNRGWGSVFGVIEAFEPSGEPDVPREKFQEHIF
jgi:uncharacterized OB-fold protein